jgi:hypothetical protein
MGSLIPIALRYPGSEGQIRHIFWENSLFPAGELKNSWKFMLSSLSSDNSATKEETFGIKLGLYGQEIESPDLMRINLIIGRAVGFEL